MDLQRNFPVCRGARTRFILPTADWFDPIRQYEEAIGRAGFNVYKLVEATIKITLRGAVGGGTSLPDAGEYGNMLTQFLLQLDVDYDCLDNTQAANVIAIIAEISTHFYNELVLLFKHMEFTDQNIRTLKIHEWVGEDLAVSIEL